jgi:type IV pilus assembly protein PilM
MALVLALFTWRFIVCPCQPIDISQDAEDLKATMGNRKSTYPIAIDIGGEHVYAAQLAQFREGFAVRELFHRRMEEAGEDSDPADRLVPVFKEIRKNKRFTGKRVSVHLPPQAVFRFPIRFQVGSEETVEEAILREARGYLPFPMEEAILDYPSLVSPFSGDGNSYKAMIVAVRREDVEQYLSMLKKAGLTPEAFDVRLASLVRLDRALLGSSPNPLLLCDMGDRESTLAVVTEDSILAQRSIPWGLQTLVQKIGSGFGFDGEHRRAETLLREYGFVYEDRKARQESPDADPDPTKQEISKAIYQILSPCVEELIHELHKIIGYMRSEEGNAPIEGIHMYGYTTWVRYLDRYLETRINIPTRLIDPVSKMVLSDETILPDKSQAAPFGLALGLAMRRL